MEIKNKEGVLIFFLMNFLIAVLFVKICGIMLSKVFAYHHEYVVFNLFVTGFMHQRITTIF